MNKNIKWNNLILISVIIVVIVFMIYKIYSLDIGIEDIKVYVDSFGKMGTIVYIIMFALVPLTLFPDSVLAIAGGLAFGFVKGYIYTTIGALIGATLSFYISRKLGRNIVKKLTNEKLDNIENMINERGFFIVFLLRLIPLFPFDIISYGAGFTSIKYKDFLLATLFGTVPGIMVFTNIGAHSLNIGSNQFYISIASLILLFATSILLKNKFLNSQIKINNK
ncbi:MAG: TVP38/TMEM64 family protein [Romboutsia sp.]